MRYNSYLYNTNKMELSDLPSELMLIIVDYLGIKEVVYLTSVARGYYERIIHQRCWFNILKSKSSKYPDQNFFWYSPSKDYSPDINYFKL